MKYGLSRTICVSACAAALLAASAPGCVPVCAEGEFSLTPASADLRQNEEEGESREDPLLLNLKPERAEGEDSEPGCWYAKFGREADQVMWISVKLDPKEKRDYILDLRNCGVEAGHDAVWDCLEQSDEEGEEVFPVSGGDEQIDTAYALLFKRANRLVLIPLEEAEDRGWKEEREKGPDDASYVRISASEDEQSDFALLHIDKESEDRWLLVPVKEEEDFHHGSEEPDAENTSAVIMTDLSETGIRDVEEDESGHEDSSEKQKAALSDTESAEEINEEAADSSAEESLQEVRMSGDLSAAATQTPTPETETETEVYRFDLNMPAQAPDPGGQDGNTAEGKPSDGRTASAAAAADSMAEPADPAVSSGGETPAEPLSPAVSDAAGAGGVRQDENTSTAEPAQQNPDEGGAAASTAESAVTEPVVTESAAAEAAAAESGPAGTDSGAEGAESMAPAVVTSSPEPPVTIEPTSAPTVQPEDDSVSRGPGSGEQTNRHLIPLFDRLNLNAVHMGFITAFFALLFLLMTVLKRLVKSGKRKSSSEPVPPAFYDEDEPTVDSGKHGGRR